MFGPMPLLNVTRFDVGLFSFVPNEAFDANQEPQYEVTVSFGMQRPDGPDAASDEFRVFLDLKFGPGADRHPNAMYDVRIALVAYFKTPVTLGDDRAKIPTRVLNNALMITYGIARGVVGQATAANERGQFVLPAMTFDSLIANANVSFEDERDAPEIT